MDFTDIIKFFNEMAERHNDDDVLDCARELVDQLREIALDQDDWKKGDKQEILKGHIRFKFCLIVAQ